MSMNHIRVIRRILNDAIEPKQTRNLVSSDQSYRPLLKELCRRGLLQVKTVECHRKMYQTTSKGVRVVKLYDEITGIVEGTN